MIEGLRRWASRTVSLRAVRAAFVVAIVLQAGFLGLDFIEPWSEQGATPLQDSAAKPFADREPIASPAENVTVMTGQGDENAPRFAGEIVAFAPDGRLLYLNKTYDNYADVDPAPQGEHTVTYIASEWAGEVCVAEYRDKCTRQIVERVNLSTGEVTRIYEHVSHRGTWHDVDRVDEDHIAVADIRRNQVLIINVTSGMGTWRWNAQQHFPLESGGLFPIDWTHLNDVEVLADGRIMASVRNQDSVVFVDRTAGVQEEWTLGEDGNHDILFEQHNPDYIPPAEGGPAVVVADSENNRIVEYQRTDGSWNRSWTWDTVDLQWPRDADRLPNGNTLISDSHGGRVFEITPAGETVWSAPFDGVYEAERLGTGDESEDGPSARRADLESTTLEDPVTKEGSRTTLEWFWIGVKDVVPSKILNGVIFLRPIWLSNLGLIVVVTLPLTAMVWGGVEYYRSPYRLTVPLRRTK